MAATAVHSMTTRDLDRLISLSRRQPMGEALISWTTVWGFLVFGFSFVFPEFFYRGDMIMLEQLSIVLVGMAVVASLLCWVHLKRTQPRVDAAKAKLRALVTDLKAKT